MARSSAFFSSAILLTTLTGCIRPRYISPVHKHSLQQVIDQISEPQKAKEWLLRLLYEEDKVVHHTGDFWASCALTYQNRAGDCEDYAICAAALLQGDIDEGYIITFHDPIKVGSGGHALLAYKQGEKWGTISNSNNEFRHPLFPSLDDVVQDVNVSKKMEDKYQVYKVFDYSGLNIFSSTENLKYEMTELGAYELGL